MKKQDVTIWGEMLDLKDIQNRIQYKIQEIKDKLGTHSRIVSIDHSLTQESGSRFYLLMIIVFDYE